MISVSSSIAEILTHPIDFIKTKKQYYKENISVSRIFFNELKKNGIRGFFISAPPAVARQMIYSPIRVNLYENLRSSESSFLQKLFAGSLAGGISQLVVSPTDVIKVKLQTQNSNLGVLDIIKKTYMNKGIGGFCVGGLPNIYRSVSNNIGKLVAYDLTKNYLLNYMDDNIYCHVLSSFHSGFWAATLSTPFDVVKTRVMAGDNRHFYSLCIEIIKNEGILSLWKGFIPIWLRHTPWQITFWVTYEQLRIVNNLGGFK